MSTTTTCGRCHQIVPRKGCTIQHYLGLRVWHCPRCGKQKHRRLGAARRENAP